MLWSYGVMTCAARLTTLLPGTLRSLANAGFPKPHLFIDGTPDGERWAREFGLNVTARFPVVLTAANWFLSMAELYCREPWAGRYFLSQDDAVFPKNLRAYLEGCEYRPRSYWNLYVFPANQALCPPGHVGWYESNQRGKGAVALVFDRDTVTALLTAKHLVGRFQDPHRGHKAVDGGIVEALGQQGVVELVHSCSLCQHTGRFSTMNKRAGSTRDETNFAAKEWGASTFATSFPGEDFDCLDLLACKT